MTGAARSESDGRVPLEVRVGVTGHRHLDETQAIADAITTALEWIRGAFEAGPATPVDLVVLSALAEGADQLVARQVLAVPRGRLDAALPMPRTAYARSFTTSASRAEFRALLARARRVWQAPPAASADEAYEQTGQHIADHCDALIAIWNGQPARGPGGTAHIVTYARERGVPLVWIQPAEGGAQIRYEGFAGKNAQIVRAAAADLGRFNATRISRPELQAEQSRLLADLGLSENSPDPAPETLLECCGQAAAWLVPHMGRADLLALRLQRRFTAISTAMFAIAAAAVAAVTIQAIFWPRQNWGAAVEIPLLLVLLAIPATRNRHRLHERWTTHRYLAERLRSAYFIALVGSGDRADDSGSQVSRADPAGAWIERALTAIAAARPAGLPCPSDIPALRQYLSSHWISSQARYHATAARRHARRDNAYRRATAALYAATLTAAVIHLFDPGHSRHLAALLITTSICAPAIGAAVHGIATQRTHRHHAQRSERSALLLTQLARQMDLACDLKHVYQVAAAAEDLFREENSDWFGVMRFRDVELIT